MFTQILKLIRIPQWIKNLFVFVPLVFSLNLFNGEYFLKVLLGFFAFCLTSGIVYIINDIMDAEADRAHPRKRNRPVASGSITVRQALVTAFIFAIGAVILCLYTNTLFSLLLLLYFLINILYSIKL